MLGLNWPRERPGTALFLGPLIAFAFSACSGLANPPPPPPKVARIVFSVQPSASSTAGLAFAQQPVITLQDASGNTVTTGPDSTAAITMTLAHGSGSLKASSLRVAAVKGVADFSNAGLNLDLIGTDKIIRATKADTTSSHGTAALTADSDAMAITSAGAAQLVFATQPAGINAAAAFVTQPVVEVKDRFGNPITTGADASVTITMALHSGTGNLTGTLTEAATNGSADFSANGLTLDISGSGRSLRASATLSEAGAVYVDSAPFAVNPGAISAVNSFVSVSSAALDVGQTSTITLTAKDVVGNLETRGGSTVTFSRTTGGGESAGTISATTDHGDGTYTAVYTATVAGTANTISASITGLGSVSGVSSITVTNLPTTAMDTPSTPTSYTIGSVTTIKATASVAAGNTLTSVQFYQNCHGSNLLIGTGSLNAGKYQINWAPSQGPCSLKSVATDNLGGSTTSTAVMTNADYVMTPLFSANTSTTGALYVVPPGVTSIQVEVWGAGGGGAADNYTYGYNVCGGECDGYGGSGGGYDRKILAVTPGQVFNYDIGAGGVGSDGGTNPSTTGGGSAFYDAGATYASAGGGIGAASSGSGGGLFYGTVGKWNGAGGYSAFAIATEGRGGDAGACASNTGCPGSDGRIQITDVSSTPFTSIAVLGDTSATSYVVPAAVSTMRAMLWGAGGGGGGGDLTTGHIGTTGGGAAVEIGVMSVSAGQSIPYAIGVGGVGGIAGFGNSTDGAPGGNTSFGSGFTALGGGGGPAGRLLGAASTGAAANYPLGIAGSAGGEGGGGAAGTTAGVGANMDNWPGAICYNSASYNGSGGLGCATNSGGMAGGNGMILLMY